MTHKVWRHLQAGTAGIGKVEQSLCYTVWPSAGGRGDFRYEKRKGTREKEGNEERMNERHAKKNRRGKQKN